MWSPYLYHVISLLLSCDLLTQVEVIRWLLNHNPHDRPTSKQLLQSPLLPLKMEDEELQEVNEEVFNYRNSICSEQSLQ